MTGIAEVDVFDDHEPDPERLVARLPPYDAVVLMRERTPFPAAVIERLPGLRLIVTTGRANASIDLEAAAGARRHGLRHREPRLGPGGADLGADPRPGPAPADRGRQPAVGPLAEHLGLGLAGRTLGVLGLGRIGSRVAAVGSAFGMEVLAWSRHLTAERAEPLGATAVDLDDLLRRSDVVSLHLPLKPETRGLLDARRIASMKPTALLVNTSRAVRRRRRRGARRHRGAPRRARARRVRPGAAVARRPAARDRRVLATPHLGYVADDLYALFFGQVVEDIVAFAAGRPVRVLG